MFRYFVCFLLVGTLIFASSCFEFFEDEINVPCEENCVVIRGRLTTGNNAQDVASGLEMELWWEGAHSFFGSPDRFIATHTSGKNGEYFFEFEPEGRELDDGEFIINILGTEVYYSQHFDFRNIDAFDVEINQDIHVPSRTRLRLILKNFSLSDSTNSWRIQAYYNAYGSPNRGILFNDSQGDRVNISFFNKNDNEFSELILDGLTAGDQYTIFESRVINTGDTIQSIDSVFVPQGNFGEFELSFQD